MSGFESTRGWCVLPDLAAGIVSILLTVSGASAFEGWRFGEFDHLPADLVQLAALDDPLAQSRLWEAIYPEIPRGFLVAKCVIESGGCTKPLGVHAGDAKFGETAYRGAWSRHKLARDCEFYPDPDDVDDPAWFATVATRGNHGMFAVYNVPHLGSCIPLDVFDVPFFSAWAAAEKARKACRRYTKKRGRPCSVQALHCHWAQAPYGSKACGRVIRRQRAKLEQHRRRMPSLNLDYHPTLAQIRRAHEESTDDHS